MTVTIDRAPPNDGQPLLVDLALRIAAFLFESGAHSTLAALHRCSKDYYFALSPIVYRKVSFKPKKSYALFFLGDDFFYLQTRWGSRSTAQSCLKPFSALSARFSVVS